MHYAVIGPVQPTDKVQTDHFMVRVEHFDEIYGGLGDFKVIIIAGHPIKCDLAPTETRIPDNALPKCKGQSKMKER